MYIYIYICVCIYIYINIYIYIYIYKRLLDAGLGSVLPPPTSAEVVAMLDTKPEAPVCTKVEPELEKRGSVARSGPRAAVPAPRRPPTQASRT